MENFEQMELDTRDELTRAVADLAKQTVRTIRHMISHCSEKPMAVSNRHNAYGIASEHYAKISSVAKVIKNDLGDILGTLANPNAQAIDAVAIMKNSVADAVPIILIAAAEMARTLDDLYTAETGIPNDTDLTPMDEIIENTYEDAEPYPDQVD